MRYRRLRRAKMTPEQEALAKYADRASVRVYILAAGIADVFKSTDSAKALEMVQSIIDNDLAPAIALAERTQADLDASYSKRSKAKLSSTAKHPRRKDPAEAKTKGKS